MSANKSVQIIVVTHRQYQMPKDPMYLPVQVGAEESQVELGFTKDNSGDNISVKNPGYSELTGLYWAWKNIDSEFVGLVHYRRHFGRKRLGKDVFSCVLSSAELAPMLEKYKVFVPKKRRYYIETLYSHYAHTMYAEHLDKTRVLISKLYPDYVRCFDAVVHRTSGYMFNMFIMRRDYSNLYCEWLFHILSELEKVVDSSKLSPFHARFYGRVSEILFNVWLEKLLTDKLISRSEIKELPLLYMEKINWFDKGRAFLEAKFLRKRYEGSF